MRRWIVIRESPSSEAALAQETQGDGACTAREMLQAVYT